MCLLRSLQPALAALLAACVLLLGLAAVSPALHALIHDDHRHAALSGVHACDDSANDHHESDASTAANLAFDDDHVCAVTLFAHGCDIAVPVVHIAPPSLNATTVAQFTELLFSRTLRGPERVCGPPALA